jgi:NAD-dependent dihydropyrimidine dehydrogenase PreA subunit
MILDQEKCIGCGICIPYCPANAISMQSNKKAVIDQEACFECGNCLRPLVVRCPTKAFSEDPGIMDTIRGIRRYFSDPTKVHGVTGVPGRGTEEVKTNDVTGRVCRGEIGIGIEMGRPCLGTDLHELEKVTMALAAIGIEFEECNPFTHLMEDRKLGTIDPKYKDEKMISAIIEFNTKVENLIPILDVVKKVAKDLNTVFSLDIIGCYEENGSLPVLPLLEQAGLQHRVNAKMNLGLGRPYKIERELA